MTVCMPGCLYVCYIDDLFVRLNQLAVCFVIIIVYNSYLTLLL